jgi:hypothetical protein
MYSIIRTAIGPAGDSYGDSIRCTLPWFCIYYFSDIVAHYFTGYIAH